MWLSIPLQVLWLLPLGVLTFAYWYIRNQFLFWAKQGVPFSKPHWLFGNIGDWIMGRQSMTELLNGVYKEFRDARFCGIWRFFSPTLVVIDPELVSNILVKDYETWSSRGMPITRNKDPLSVNLINLDGEEWKSMRTSSSPAYTPGKLKLMFEPLVECSKGLEKYINTQLMQNNGVLETGEMCRRFLTDVNGLCGLGIHTDSLNGDSPLYQILMKDITEVSLKQKISYVMQVVSMRFFKFLRLSIRSPEMTDFFLKVVKEALEYHDKNNTQNRNFLSLLRDLQSTGKPRTDVDDKRLAAQLFDFFLGAFESTSRTIGFALHELAVNQGIQDRLREEVRLTKAADDGKTVWETLNNMKYLDMVVQETLRKYPFPLHFRMCVKPYRIPDTKVVLPSGTMCFIPVCAIHHDPKYYPEPEKFDPERFTNEAKSRRSAHTFLPFGFGPRNCIGLRFGELQLKVAVSAIIENFKISLSEKSQNPLEFDPEDLNLYPIDGIWLRFVKNSSN